MNDIKNKNTINLKDKINEENKSDINLDLLLKDNYIDNEHNVNNSNSLEETLNNQSSKSEEEDNKVKSEKNIDIIFNDIIIDDIINVLKDIKNIINNNDIDLNEKVISLSANIKYPEYFSYYQGLNFYKDKFLYLLSTKIDNRFRIYPDYIEYEQNLHIIENKKRLFRSSWNNYTLNENYQLCFLEIKSLKKDKYKKRNENNRHLKKNINDCNLLIIPTKNNV